MRRPIILIEGMSDYNQSCILMMIMGLRVHIGYVSPTLYYAVLCVT